MFTKQKVMNEENFVQKIHSMQEIDKNSAICSTLVLKLENPVNHSPPYQILEILSSLLA